MPISEWFLETGPIWLSIRLAFVTTLILILIGAPLAWWLSQTRSVFKTAVEAVIALPVVLPPTVLGFYLLVLLGPAGAIGEFWLQFSDQSLTFSFTGLVIASIVYSFPFVVQPLQNAFEDIGSAIVEAAWTLGAGPLDTFFTVIVPLASRGFLTAAVMGFAHTLGEFGVILMVGGNIPGETRVISIAIYDHVESMNYQSAHRLSILLLVFAFCALFLMYFFNRRWRYQR